MNPLQFGDIGSSNSSCGQWILIQNRKNTARSTLARVVGVCDECEYGSVELSLPVLTDLAPEARFDEVAFDPKSSLTLMDVADDTTQPVTISPLHLINIMWRLSKPPTEAAPEPEPSPLEPSPTPTSTVGEPSLTTDAAVPAITATDTATTEISATTTTTTSTTTTTTTSTTTTTPTATKTKNPPKPTDEPEPPKMEFSGQGRLFSDRYNRCELCEEFSPNDRVVVVNEEHMGRLCGKKVVVTYKNKDSGSVHFTATVAGTCPPGKCKFEDLLLSKAAFKKLTENQKGLKRVVQLQWRFEN
ncbi:hypothetical protein BGX28_007665 [Mortierella sp. GBA30]|nr:hypothetical protein BGX28_007665 [Mortierella sp. GBA30]